MVSVIIPCYNAQNWIKECLISVLNQTYSNFEVLVIDDGSTDDSSIIIKSFNDKRIHYCYKANGGLSSARNYGLYIAKGVWIAFLDADDIWVFNKLEKSLKDSENCEIIFSDFEIINQNTQIVKTFNNIHPKNYNYNYKKQILRGNIISGGSCIMLRREVVINIGEFNTQLKVGEDWDYWARTIWGGFRLKFVNEKLTYVRQHENSMQKITSKDVWLYDSEIILKSFLTFKNISDKEKSCIYKKLTIVAYGLNNDYKKYFNSYLKCINLDKTMILDKTLLWLSFKFPLRYILK